MRKFLVADDDTLSRDVIGEIIANHFHPAAVRTATDGSEALEIAKAFAPDVIITDVRMPNMDGIALLTEIVKLQLDMQMIIISGYGDFQYAKSAIRIGAADYLLKPYSENELVESVGNALDRIEKKQHELNEHVELSRDTMVREILEGRYRRLIDKTLAAHYFGKGWHDVKQWRVGLLFLENSGRPDANKDIREKTLLEFSVENVVSEWIACYKSIFYCSWDAGEWVLIIGGANSPAIWDELRGIIKKYTGISVDIAVSRQLEDLDLVPEGLKEALLAKEQKNASLLERLRLSKPSQNYYITKALKMINERYSEDLSLMKLAEELEITHNYLSALFKDELNLTFLEVLTTVRINKAKYLLLNTPMKNYEIAESIGYKSTEYFSKVFKKYTGYSTYQYRNHFVK